MLWDPAFPWTCSCMQSHDVTTLASSSIIGGWRGIESGLIICKQGGTEFQKEVRNAQGNTDMKQNIEKGAYNREEWSLGNFGKRIPDKFGDFSMGKRGCVWGVCVGGCMPSCFSCVQLPWGRTPWTESESRSVMSDSLWPHGLCSPRNSPGQNTEVGSLSLLQGIFPTQGSNPGLLHCRRILYQLSHQGSPRILEWVAYPFSRGSSRPRNWTGVSYVAGGFFIPRTIDHQSPLSTGFSRKEYWGGFPCPPPGYLPNSGIKPMFLMSPALAGEFFSTSISCEAHAGYAGGQFF